MYQAPPVEALKLPGGQQEARERTQKSNFSLRGGNGVQMPVTTQNQANNLIRQNEWDKGQIQSKLLAGKPADSINFGQACEYTSEAKSTFVMAHG